jgi:predicted component of type VI protein secretion system
VYPAYNLVPLPFGRIPGCNALGAGWYLEAGKQTSGVAGMQAVLVMFRADGERRSFSVTRDMTVVGRREDCDLRIPLGDISRKHCRFVRDGDMLRIEDLGSSNGTYHNGQRIDKEAVLQAGDSVQVGPVVFVVQIDGYPAEEELRPVTTEAATTPAYSGQGDDAPEPMTISDIEPLPEGEILPGAESLPEAELLPEADVIDELEPLPLPEDESHLG